MDAALLQIGLLALAAVTLVTVTWKGAKARRSAWGVSALLLWAGVLSFTLNVVSGSSVDANGVLHEQFVFVPIGWAFLLAGITSAFVAGLRSLLHREVSPT